MALISLEQGLRQLRLITDDYVSGDAVAGVEDVEMKIVQASAIVLDYLKNPEGSEYWDPETTNPVIQAATLLVLSDLYEHRAGSAGEDVFLSAAVKSLLHRFRDPTLA